MSDFFTRLIAVNEAGPNMPAAGQVDPSEIQQVYVCEQCEAAHDHFTQAEDCCRPEVFREYRCPTCRETHTERADAAHCCGDGGPAMCCPLCMKSAESYEDAADCCLFKHPLLTQAGRQMVAKAVEGGQPWSAAVAAHINH